MDELNVKDRSSDRVRDNALQQLSWVPCASSVGVYDVPRKSVGKHLGSEDDADRGEDGAMND